MIDLHAHVVFGVDDGARSLEESRLMLEAARADGITHIAATSHFRPGHLQTYKEHQETVRIAAEEAGITLLNGFEYNFSTLPDLPPAEVRCLGNSRFILVDLNQSFVPPAFSRVVFQWHLENFQIILAHPERMVSSANLESFLKIMEENGVYLQINTGSLLGRYGQEARKNVFRILEKNACHILANDAHRPEGFHFSSSRKIIEKNFGDATFALLAQTNPQRVLNGELPLKTNVKKSFFRRFKFF